MKKTFIIVCLLSAFAVAAEPEQIILNSATITDDKLTETAAGNGMFYSEKTGVAFLSGGTEDNKYDISDPTKVNLSRGNSAAVNVGSFIGESHISIGAASATHVYTENSMFIGGFGWYNDDSTWYNNASFTSNNTDRDTTMAAHEGSVTVHKGSTLEVGTGLGETHNIAGGSQLYIGHGAKGTLTVDGGSVISHAHLNISVTASSPTTDNSGLLDIKNGGTVTITAEPKNLTPSGNNAYSYNQLLVGSNNVGVGEITISGLGSNLTFQSSTDTDKNGNPFYTFASIGRDGGTGVMTITDNATANIGTATNAATMIYVGYGVDSNGTVNVNNNATANLEGYVYVGDNGGTGVMNVGSHGAIEQTYGAFYIGHNTGKGSVNVAENGVLNAQAVYLGLNSGKDSSLLIEKGGATQVVNDLQLIAASDTDSAHSLTNHGSLTVGTHIVIGAYNKVTNSGSMTAGKTIWLNTGSDIKNTGSMQGNSIVIGANQAITNDGVMTATTSEAEGIQLGDGASIRNNGTLSGNIIGSGVVDGIGKMADVTIGESTTLVVGETITGLQVTESITLGSGSTTVFNIAGLDLAASGNNDGWASGTHSVIRVDDGRSAAVDKGAAFELIFGGTEIWDDMTMEGDTIIWDFTLTLIDGGVAAGSIDLDTLLSNTTFSLTTDPSGATGLNSLNVTNAHYEITQDGDLILTGSIAVPEPTTATLSLLALAGLAARRRRK